MISRFKLLFSLLGLVCLGIANAQPSKTNDAQIRAALEVQLKSLLHQCPKTLVQAIGFQSLPAVAVNQLFLDCNKEIADAYTDNKKSLDKSLDELQKQSLERDRKSIDWWLAVLSIFTAIIAVGGALMPFLLARKDKEALELALKNVEASKATLTERVNQSEALLSKLQALVVSGQKKVSSLDGFVSSAKVTKEQRNKTDKQVSAVLADSLASDEDKLLARAVAASNIENPTIEQAHTAFELWQALCVINPNDADYQFNAGYWAQELYEQVTLENKKQYFTQAEKHYALALSLKPDDHGAANNWGNVLDSQAAALAASDLAGAQTLWKQAGEKYDKALKLKPDYHEAAYNWGSALDSQAAALAASDLVGAQALWQQACEKYGQALSIKPDDHAAAYNWGSALDSQAAALAASDLVGAQTLWKQACEKYGLVSSIKPDKHAAAHNWGSALGNQANLLAVSDLAGAQALWQQAGEKYAQALSFKPDYHEAAVNWGCLLINEYSAVKNHDSQRANACLAQAKSLLESHAENTQGLCSYNLACLYALEGNAQAAIERLEQAKQFDMLRPAEFIRYDQDFNLIRQHPDFVAWWQKTFPNEAVTLG